MQKILYNETEFTIPTLSSKNGYSFDPDDSSASWLGSQTPMEQTTLNELNTIWDQRRFETPRLPVVVGKVVDQKRFSKASNLRILDLPVKFPNTNYRVPEECSQFNSLIEMIASLEAQINPFANQLYAYLTIDQSQLKKGSTQRKPGLHVDGFQGARIQPKLMIDHSYLVSDHCPTVFSAQGFKTSHLDERIHNFFLDFEKQENEKMIWTPKEFDICLMNAYQVHKASYARSNGERTFFRLSFTLREFDRLGNTHNPLFDYNWEMVPRDINSVLTNTKTNKEKI